MKKVVYIFSVTKAIHTNKDNCDRKSAAKMFKFLFYMIVCKTKLSKVEFVWLDSGREPNLSGSESDMSTVHARSKICPCVPPSTRCRGIKLGNLNLYNKTNCFSQKYFILVFCIGHHKTPC